MKALLSTTTRKSIYGVVIALNGLLGVVIPVLVSQGVIEASTACRAKIPALLLRGGKIDSALALGFVITACAPGKFIWVSTLSTP